MVTKPPRDSNKYGYGIYTTMCSDVSDLFQRRLLARIILLSFHISNHCFTIVFIQLRTTFGGFRLQRKKFPIYEQAKQQLMIHTTAGIYICHMWWALTIQSIVCRLCLSFAYIGLPLLNHLQNVLQMFYAETVAKMLQDIFANVLAYWTHVEDRRRLRVK